MPHSSSLVDLFVSFREVSHEEPDIRGYLENFSIYVDNVVLPSLLAEKLQKNREQGNTDYTEEDARRSIGLDDVLSGLEQEYEKDPRAKTFTVSSHDLMQLEAISVQLKPSTQDWALRFGQLEAIFSVLYQNQLIEDLKGGHPETLEQCLFDLYGFPSKHCGDHFHECRTRIQIIHHVFEAMSKEGWREDVQRKQAFIDFVVFNQIEMRSVFKEQYKTFYQSAENKMFFSTNRGKLIGATVGLLVATIAVGALFMSTAYMPLISAVIFLSCTTLLLSGILIGAQIGKITDSNTIKSYGSTPSKVGLLLGGRACTMMSPTPFYPSCLQGPTSSEPSINSSQEDKFPLPDHIFENSQLAVVQSPGILYNKMKLPTGPCP